MSRSQIFLNKFKTIDGRHVENCFSAISFSAPYFPLKLNLNAKFREVNQIRTTDTDLISACWLITAHRVQILGLVKSNRFVLGPQVVDSENRVGCLVYI